MEKVLDLTMVVAYLAAHNPIKGKKALQKLVYFCKEMGVPLRCQYRIYLYGPFSREVALEHNTWVWEGILKETPAAAKEGENHIPVYEPGEKCTSYLSEHSQDIAPHKDKLDRVLKLFGNKSPWELELYATMHFVCSALDEVYEERGVEVALREVKAVKGDKFSEAQIQDAYRDLVAWGLLHDKEQSVF